jgi:hypothetical protein
MKLLIAIKPDPYELYEMPGRWSRSNMAGVQDEEGSFQPNENFIRK